MKVRGNPRFLFSLLVLLSSFFILTSCEEEDIEETETPEVPLLTDGVFDGTFSQEGFGTTVNYIKFFPENETGKSIYYMSVSNDQDQLSGYYTIEETDYAYSTWYNRDDRLSIAAETLEITGTAKYTISLYDFSDNLLTEFGYDVKNYSGIIYNFNLVDYPDFIQNVCFYQKTENLDVYEETPVEIYDYMISDDITSKFTVFHDGTFVSTTGETIEGTWTVDSTGQVLTLIDTNNQTYGTLSVSSDGERATFLPTEGTKINLIQAVSELLITYSGRDTNHVFTTATTLDIFLYLYTDNTVEIEVQYGGIALEGTWSMDESNIYVFDLSGDEIVFNSGSGNSDNSEITINVTNSLYDSTGDLVFTLGE